MRKAQYYTVICITFFIVLMAIFGTMNHYNPFYDLSSYKNKSGNNGNSNQKPNPTPTPTPTPNPNPSTTDKDVNGYKCETDNCDIVENTDVINNKYEFVKDGDNNVVLYNIEGKENVDKYQSVEAAGDTYVVKTTEGTYGIIKIFDTVTSIVDAKYKMIKYNSVDKTFVLSTDKASFIADSEGKKISSDYTADIIQYNEKYIVTKSSNNEYHVFNFNNREYLTEYYNGKRLFIELVGDYVGVITNTYMYQLYDFSTATTKLVAEVQVPDNSTTARARIVDNKVEIYDGETVLKTIDL